MSKYQKRHYIDISKILRLCRAPDEIIMEFAALFTEDNEQFDFVKFLEACKYRGC